MGYRARALLGFAGFGFFWGAPLPQIQAHAGATDAQLGLLCIGAGALVSMRPAGARVDRLGPGMTSVMFALFAGSALLPGLAASPLALAGALLVLGALSGAVDVAINAEAAHSEAEGNPAMNLSHAFFSASVVGASVLVGVLRTIDLEAPAVLGTVAVLLLAIDVAITRIRVARVAQAAEAERLLLVLGGLAAIAYLVENAWQSWNAVYLAGPRRPAGRAGPARQRRLGGHHARLHRLPDRPGRGGARGRGDQPGHRARRDRGHRRHACRTRPLRSGASLTFCRASGVQTRRSAHCPVSDAGQAWTA